MIYRIARVLGRVFAFLLVVMLCGCGAPTSNVNQYAEGETLYTTYCASCHEIDNGIGPRLTREVVATRVNGQLLFNYNKRNMPYQAGNTLTDDQYWSVTAYMLMREGFMDRETKLSAENASQISLE